MQCAVNSFGLKYEILYQTPAMGNRDGLLEMKAYLSYDLFIQRVVYFKIAVLRVSNFYFFTFF